MARSGRLRIDLAAFYLGISNGLFVTRGFITASGVAGTADATIAIALILLFYTMDESGMVQSISTLLCGLLVMPKPAGSGPNTAWRKGRTSQ
ncbi:hypothetical protein [Paraburkholderia rhizosphaerae]|uniref:hypothetical protein n=1 Tax=Paraburkholderia rhizosphaerae TaxID=480658 RepID=UPI0010666923|nr:hypothetical protein [Paraburkholderia rhizosphaerae]